MDEVLDGRAKQPLLVRFGGMADDDGPARRYLLGQLSAFLAAGAQAEVQQHDTGSWPSVDKHGESLIVAVYRVVNGAKTSVSEFLGDFYRGMVVIIKNPYIHCGSPLKYSPRGSPEGLLPSGVLSGEIFVSPS